jgi:hypothetical protein
MTCGMSDGNIFTLGKADRLRTDLAAIESDLKFEPAGLHACRRAFNRRRPRSGDAGFQTTAGGAGFGARFHGMGGRAKDQAERPQLIRPPPIANRDH